MKQIVQLLNLLVDIMDQYVLINNHHVLYILVSLKFLVRRLLLKEEPNVGNHQVVKVLVRIEIAQMQLSIQIILLVQLIYLLVLMMVQVVIQCKHHALFIQI